MRAKLSDQDLTNYALNDGLDTRERLYIESMLGVSEECRNDVYRMLDVVQMLEEGFEQQEDTSAATLTAEQRDRLLTAPEPFDIRPFLRQAAATISLAACVALAFAGSHLGLVQRRAHRVASVSSEVSRMVSDAMANEEPDIASWVNPPTLSNDDSGSYIQTSGEEMPVDSEEMESAECTPPTLINADYSTAE